MKLGDKIRFVDETGEAEVVALLQNGMLRLQDSDGLVYEYPANKCYVVSCSDDELLMFDRRDSKDCKGKNQTKAKSRRAKMGGGSASSEIEEYDLHVNSGKDSLEVQLAFAMDVLYLNKRRVGKKIVFIHGQGKGILKNAIRSEVKRLYPNFLCYDAPFAEYGTRGATIVEIKR